MEDKDLAATAEQYLVPTYQRPEVEFVRGKGLELFDKAGNRYLDLASGIAVNALGHADPGWLKAVTEQAGRLSHVSNLYLSAPHVELARRLAENSFADQVFFSNSGAEANEAALKFARRWAGAQGRHDQTGVVAFEGGFHGRTVGALSMTWKEKFKTPFQPLMPGVTFAPFNDLKAAKQAITDEICAVFVEPVQGESGVWPATEDFLQGLRGRCDEVGALLVFDEVQCGLGRTGTLWAYEQAEVTPDIMTLAKPLAGGLPIGATLVRQEIGEAIEVGDHGSTFAGGALVCAAANAVLDRIMDPDLLESVKDNGEYALEFLRNSSWPHVKDVRGRGLLVGVEFDRPVKPLIEAALAAGVVVINAGDNVLRLCPPLVIERDQLDEGLEMLAGCVQAWAEGNVL